MPSAVVRRPVWARTASVVAVAFAEQARGRQADTKKISKVTGNSLAMYLKWLLSSMPELLRHLQEMQVVDDQQTRTSHDRDAVQRAAGAVGGGAARRPGWAKNSSIARLKSFIPVLPVSPTRHTGQPFVHRTPGYHPVL